ncbi:MAG: sensor histidine kinase, partial [Hyphomicrobiales bacterium]
ITSELVPGAHRAGLDLGFDAQVEAAIIECDPILITEVIRNLVSNAMIYAGPNASATVRVMHAGKLVIIEVEDDGPGIAPELRARATERFVRLPGETSTRGAGLGLAIVAEIARISDARLSLDPGSGGAGLVVRLSFPAGE